MSCGCGCGGEEVAYEDWGDVDVSAAEYQGRKVTLNKPFRTPGANKKFGVYTMGPNGNVVIVRFGDPNMEIKRDDPKRRKAFRDRHNCDNPGPKYKARYWSCRQWRGGKKVEAGEEPCGCGCMDDFEAEEGNDIENLEAEMLRRGVYDNPGEAMEEAKRMGCDAIHQHEENGKTVFMPCKTHEEYMSKNKGKDVEVESYYMKKNKKEEEEASYHGSCKPGYEKRNGKCERIAVTLEIEIEDVEAKVMAETGKTVYEIRGIAFHQGMNKNKWSLTPAGAKSVVDQMQGADLTLMHPKANEHGAGFTRSTEGIEESNVGYIVSATFLTTNAGYDVRYVAHVTQEELFASLEDGLWQQDDYGVSIGGSGIPVSADEDGLVFGEDFTFDHLALVRRPAYERANVETVERKELEEAPMISSENEQNIISHSIPAENIEPMVIAMTEEETMIENTEAMEAIQAELVLANSRIAEYEAEAAARVEAERMTLVEKATELGMSGHEDLSTPTLETLIASWEAAHPEPAPVEMAPVESVEKPVEASMPGEEEKPVVSNYLNGRLVTNDEKIYSKAWNAWASAWNKTLAADERSRMTAPSYESMKEMI
tara:strand:+ start:837 stop:2627 length:1791 start_codon:yes stop_codon:yes gene_type:complete